MNYTTSDISDIISGKLIMQGADKLLHNIVYDSRKISFPKASIFFAFITQNDNGHSYIFDAYKKGIRNYVVSELFDHKKYPGANFIIVKDTLLALQKLAQKHREKFDIPIIGITGSNGKTILKEWLHKALSKSFLVVQSPNSFNSQIGVALSLLQIKSQHELAIIEAGISQKGEMVKLEKMIAPTLGILTNIGDAHSIGFNDQEEKTIEKCSLFTHSTHIIFNNDAPLISQNIKKELDATQLSWGVNEQSFYTITEIQKTHKTTIVKLQSKGNNLTFEIPFTNKEFVDLSLHFITCLLFLNQEETFINNELKGIDLLPNRLQINKGENGCILINDSYSADMASLQLAFEYQDQHNKDLGKALIFSDFDHQLDKASTYNGIAKLIKQKNIQRAFAIGIDRKYHDVFNGLNVSFFESVASLSSYFLKNKISNTSILIKGARRFKLERIFEQLTLIVHQTVLETNFSALENNINVYKSFLKNDTKVMAVIKADAYGSGSVAISEFLQQKGIDYLAVALIDEAIEIRKAGCILPIMVFNIQDENLQKLWEYDLEPEIYSIELLEKIALFSRSQQRALKIHLKIDTGMHRLGIEPSNVDEVLKFIKPNKIEVESILSHLAASENSTFDAFTQSQFNTFDKIYATLSKELGYKPKRHILNTGGIIRFPEHQHEMVRIGLGLYGIDSTQSISKQLMKVHTLKARILQIKNLNSGESTGYSRSGKVDKFTKVAIVGLGYADGILRSAGNGRIKVLLHDRFCPTIGNICMDVMMIDVTDVPYVENYDEVEIFGLHNSIEAFATACDTITYEIISRISPRVKRVYTYN